MPFYLLLFCFKKYKNFFFFFFCREPGAVSWYGLPLWTACVSNEEGTRFSSQDNGLFDWEYTKAELQVCKNKQGWSQSKVVLHSVLLNSMHFRSYVQRLGLLNYRYPGWMLMDTEDSPRLETKALFWPLQAIRRKKGSCIWKITEQEAPQTRIWGRFFLNASLMLLWVGWTHVCPTFLLALLSMSNRLLRQRVGGHSRETCRLEMEILIIQCLCI